MRPGRAPELLAAALVLLAACSTTSNPSSRSRSEARPAAAPATAATTAGDAPAAANPGMPAGHPPVDMPGQSQPTGGAAPAAGGVVSVGSLAATVPEGWVVEPPTSGMRKGQYRLPRVENDAEDASVVVFHFGPQAGTREANIERWASQMIPESGASHGDAAKPETWTSHGMEISMVDLTGRYEAGMGMPGQPAAPARTGYRMLAAIVASPDGDYYVKAVGPAATVARWRDSIRAFIDSLVPAPAH